MKIIMEAIFLLIILLMCCLFVGHTEINAMAPYVHIKYPFRTISLLLYLIFMYVMATKYGK